MTGTSVETRLFTEVPVDESFRIDPPLTASSVVSDPMEISHSPSGTEVLPAFDRAAAELPSVERTLDEVIMRCEHDLQTRPQNHRSEMNLALALLNRGRVEDGIQHLHRALELRPNDFIATNTLAATYFHKGDLVSAGDLYSALIEHFPQSPSGYMGLASIGLRNGDFLASAKLLERAVFADPKLTTAQYLLAMVQFKLQKPHRAIAVLRTALREDNRSPELNQGLAVAYLMVGEFHRAERSFQAALSLNPNFASAIHGLSILWLRENRLEEATTLLSHRLEREPNDVKSRELIAHAFVTGAHYKQASAHLQRIKEVLLSSQPNNIQELARISNNLGACLASEGKLNDAKQNLQASILCSPTFAVQPYANLARIYFAERSFSKALNTVDAAFSAGLLSTDLGLLREVCLVNMGRHQDAIDELWQIISRGDAPAPAYADLGWLLTEWARSSEIAIGVLKNGFEKWPQNPIIINNLAYAYLQNGDSARAQHVLALMPSDYAQLPYAVATRGLLHLQEGQIDEGERLYAMAESLAQREGNPSLAASIRQKRYLEVARALLRAGMRSKALEYAKRGYAIGRNNQPYPFLEQLEALMQSLDMGQ